MNRTNQQTRLLQSKLKIREEQNGQAMHIEGYFAVFNKVTELWPGAYEQIAPEAFNETLGNDVRALINHETKCVLGRNTAGSLTLKVDNFGLWGRIAINPKDSEAVNLYERVKRGDVDQCSFGFNILDEDTDMQHDGSIKWTIRKIDLHEVSVVTFPAYKDTSVQARKADMDRINRSNKRHTNEAKTPMSLQELEERKETLRMKLRKIDQGIN